MAETKRGVVLRLSTEGAETVRNALKALGKDGEDALKRLDRAAKGVSPGLGALDSAVAGVQQRLTRLFTIGAIIYGAKRLANGIKEITQEFSDLVDESEKTGVGVEALQELRFGAEKTGASVETLDAALAKFRKNMANAARGEGSDFSKILQLNGVALTDAEGNLRPVNDLLRDYADLVKNAKDEGERLVLINAAFGKGMDDLVGLFREGSEGLDRYAEKRRELGPITSEEDARRLKEINDEWDRISETIDLKVKKSLVDVVNITTLLLQQLQGKSDVGLFRRIAGSLGIGVPPLVGDEDVGGGNGPLRVQVSSFRKPGEGEGEKPTKLPSLDKEIDRLRKQFDDALKSTNKQTDALLAQADALGMAAGAAAEFVKRQELINLAEQNKIALTPAVLASIDQEAAAYGRATGALEKMRNAQSAQAEVARSLFDIAKSATSLADAFDKLGEKIAEAALEAALLGTGPIAKLFGGESESGGVLGSVVGAIASLFGGGKASGGPLDPGKWYVAGERGPEPIWGGGQGAFAAGYPGATAGPRTVVNVINNSPAPVREERRQSGGVEIVDIVIGAVESGIRRGRFDGANRDRFGLAPRVPGRG